MSRQPSGCASTPAECIKLRIQAADCTGESCGLPKYDQCAGTIFSHRTTHDQILKSGIYCLILRKYRTGPHQFSKITRQNKKSFQIRLHAQPKLEALILEVNNLGQKTSSLARYVTVIRDIAIKPVHLSHRFEFEPLQLRPRRISYHRRSCQNWPPHRLPRWSYRRRHRRR